MNIEHVSEPSRESATQPNRPAWPVFEAPTVTDSSKPSVLGSFDESTMYSMKGAATGYLPLEPSAFADRGLFSHYSSSAFPSGYKSANSQPEKDQQPKIETGPARHAHEWYGAMTPSLFDFERTAEESKQAIPTAHTLGPSKAFSQAFTGMGVLKSNIWDDDEEEEASTEIRMSKLNTKGKAPPSHHQAEEDDDLKPLYDSRRKSYAQAAPKRDSILDNHDTTYIPQRHPGAKETSLLGARAAAAIAGSSAAMAAAKASRSQFCDTASVISIPCTRPSTPGSVYGSKSKIKPGSAPKVDRVQRYQQMQASWDNDKFLRHVQPGTRQNPAGGARQAAPQGRKPVNFHSYFSSLHALNQVDREAMLKATRHQTNRDLSSQFKAPNENRRDALRSEIRKKFEI